VNIPKLYSVPAKVLNSPVLVFEENPGLCKSWQGKRYAWSVRDQQTEWSHFHYLMIRHFAETEQLTTILLMHMTKLIHVTAVIVG
jgi:hypothetical protein